jgi:hypothetical protein
MLPQTIPEVALLFGVDNQAIMFSGLHVAAPTAIAIKWMVFANQVNNIYG